MKIGVVSTTRLVRRGEEMVPNNDHWMKIQEIDLESVKGKLKERKGWWWGLWHSVTHLEEEYRRFLYLIAEDPKRTVVPWSQALDDFWHEHILDTRKYREDCERVFGEMIHHNPHLPKGTKEHARATLETRRAYHSSFASSPSCSSMPFFISSSCGGGGHHGGDGGHHGSCDGLSSCGSGVEGGSGCGGSGCGGGGCGSGG